MREVFDVKETFRDTEVSVNPSSDCDIFVKTRSGIKIKDCSFLWTKNSRRTVREAGQLLFFWKTETSITKQSNTVNETGEDTD